MIHTPSTPTTINNNNNGKKNVNERINKMKFEICRLLSVTEAFECDVYNHKKKRVNLHTNHAHPQISKGIYTHAKPNDERNRTKNRKNHTNK